MCFIPTASQGDGRRQSVWGFMGCVLAVYWLHLPIILIEIFLNVFRKNWQSQILRLPRTLIILSLNRYKNCNSSKPLYENDHISNDARP